MSGDEKTECGFVEENSGEPCQSMLTDDERPVHMFHVHGIPSAVKIIHEEPESVASEAAEKAAHEGEEINSNSENQDEEFAPEPIEQKQPKCVKCSATFATWEELDAHAASHIKQPSQPSKWVNPILANAQPMLNRHQRQEARKVYENKVRALGTGHTRCPECDEVISSSGKKKHMLEAHGIGKQDAPKLLTTTNENRLVRPEICPFCESSQGFQRWGKKNGVQLWNCKKCKKKFINDTNEDREENNAIKDSQHIDKHLETITKSYEKQKKKYKKAHKVSDENVCKAAVKSFEKEDDVLVAALLKESQTAHKALDVLLPMIIGTGNSAYLIDALAELHDLRQEKKNGGLK